MLNNRSEVLSFLIKNPKMNFNIECLHFKKALIPSLYPIALLLLADDFKSETIAANKMKSLEKDFDFYSNLIGIHLATNAR